MTKEQIEDLAIKYAEIHAKEYEECTSASEVEDAWIAGYEQSEKYSQEKTRNNAEIIQNKCNAFICEQMIKNKKVSYEACFQTWVFLKLAEIEMSISSVSDIQQDGFLNGLRKGFGIF